MPIPILQCGDCKFNLRWEIKEDNFPGIYICDKYLKGIPNFVEDGSGDCPQFKEKNK